MKKTIPTKAAALLFTSALILTSVTPINTYAARTTETAVFSDIGMTVNGEELNMRPVIINGTSYFPVRTIGYALNCKTEWIADTKSIILTSQGKEAGDDTFEQGSGTAEAIFDDEISLTADGKNVNTSIAIVDNRSYVPIKTVAEAMGKRAAWDEDTRTIQIVDPQTVVVDDDIKDYYVYDLPEIKTQEDYLVGNWKGYLDTWAKLDYEYFITKNDDGTYKVIVKSTIAEDTDEYKEYAGNSSVDECTGHYDSETNKLLVTDAKNIYREEPYGEEWGDDYLVLDGDVLNMPYEDNIKEDEDFKNGKLTRF